MPRYTQGQRREILRPNYAQLRPAKSVPHEPTRGCTHFATTGEKAWHSSVLRETAATIRPSVSFATMPTTHPTYRGPDISSRAKGVSAALFLLGASAKRIISGDDVVAP